MKMRNVKSLFKSKTFYYGLLWLLLGVANLFGFADFQPDEKLNDIAEILNGILIIIFRIMTNGPVKV